MYVQCFRSSYTSDSEYHHQKYAHFELADKIQRSKGIFHSKCILYSTSYSYCLHETTSTLPHSCIRNVVNGISDNSETIS